MRYTAYYANLHTTGADGDGTGGRAYRAATFSPSPSHSRGRKTDAGDAPARSLVPLCLGPAREVVEALWRPAGPDGAWQGCSAHPPGYEIRLGRATDRRELVSPPGKHRFRA